MILIKHTPRLKANNYLHSLTVVVDDIADAKLIAEQFLQKMKLVTNIHENVLLNVEHAQQKQKKIYADDGSTKMFQACKRKGSRMRLDGDKKGSLRARKACL